MKRSFFILLISFLPFVVYSQQAGTSVVPRLLQLKIKEGDEAKVKAGRFSVQSDSTVNVGIQRLDVLNQQFGVSKMQRIYPDAGAYEAKHRKYGLHLWYELVLDEDVDPVLAADFYKAAGVVEDAEPVYRIVRIDGLASKDRDTIAHTSYQQTSSEVVRSVVANDPHLPKQWHYHNDGSIAGSIAGVDINLFDAWDVTMGSQNVIVAILDGGIDYTHEDLASNMWTNPAEIPGNGVDDDDNKFIDDIYGYDFYGNSGNIIADNHGTHVAGTIAAASNNNKGVAGIAGGSGSGDGVRLMSCQIFEANGIGGATTTNIRRAFIYAADHGAVICQNSWSLDTPNYQDPTILDAIKYFIKEAGTDAAGVPLPNTPMVGGIVIFAAGNNKSSTKYYPQAHSEVMAVAAVGPNGKKAAYSNYGDWVDITAPGGHYPAPQNQQVYSTLAGFPGNKYGYDAGTSMACPHVSGIAALVLSKHGHSAYTPDSLRRVLYASTRSLDQLDPTYAPDMGAGLADASLAVRCVLARSVAINPATVSLLDNRTAQLSAEILPASTTNKKVIWSSSSPCVTVDEDGTIQGFFDKGKAATITAYTVDGNFKATCEITVYREKIAISESFFKLLKGQKAQLTASIIPTNVENRQILWRSSNPACVSVDAEGNIEALCNGGESAIITAYSNDVELEAVCEVSIYTDVTAPEGFSPNNDGYNDLFELVLQDNIKYSLRVFDKSGQLHYESLDYQNNWNGVANKGAIKGKKVPTGTYYYVLTSNESLVKRGYIIIKY